MGILRFLFRIFLGGRARPHRKSRRVRHHPTPDIILVEPIVSPWGQCHTAELPILSTVAGPCWVIDGDTIVIDKVTIRLFGIDAPELDHPYGQKAKWALLELCKGQVIRAVFDGCLSHDRSVATCYLPDGRDLSAEMVKTGLALDWPKYSGGKYRPYEHPGMRRILWRADARQKGRFPPSPRHEA